jgi:hypothetical protein
VTCQKHILEPTLADIQNGYFADSYVTKRRYWREIAKTLIFSNFLRKKSFAELS